MMVVMVVMMEHIRLKRILTQLATYDPVLVQDHAHLSITEQQNCLNIYFPYKIAKISPGFWGFGVLGFWGLGFRV